jgi:hypothetical protein
MRVALVVSERRIIDNAIPIPFMTSLIALPIPLFDPLDNGRNEKHKYA